MKQAAIDWDLCIKLAGHKKDVAREILVLVVEQLPVDLQEILRVTEEKDYRELLRLVHKLHGALCYTGMPELKKGVAEFEGYLKRDVVEDGEVVEISRGLEVGVKRVLDEFGGMGED